MSKSKQEVQRANNAYMVSEILFIFYEAMGENGLQCLAKLHLRG